MATSAPRKRGTVRQQKLAKAIVENLVAEKPLNKGELLESTGYSNSTATAYPGVILEQAGVKTELALLGFSEEKAKHVVASIMNSDDEESKDRLKAAEMVFKVFGSFKEGAAVAPPSIHYNLFYSPKFQDTMRAAEAEMKNLIIHAKPVEETPEAQA